MSNQEIRWIHAHNRNYQTVLFIGRPTSLLANQLYEALGQCGQLSMSLHADSKLISACTAYDCYVLDADYLGDVSTTMDHILSKQPKARILIVSDSFDWEDAVNAFRLGAINVIRTPFSSMMTREMLKYVMQQQLPQRKPYNAEV